MNGEDGKRKHLRKRQKDTTSTSTATATAPIMAVIDEEYTETSGTDEEAESLLPSTSKANTRRSNTSLSSTVAATSATLAAADVSIV